MTLFILIISIMFLILLITTVDTNPFLAFILVSLVAGLGLGIPTDQVMLSIKKGIGDILGDLAIIVVVGAMLGKLVAESGAAQKISESLIRVFGQRYLLWAMMITGFILGIPLFYGVGFVLLVPLVFSVVYTTGLPAVYVGVPLLAALSVTHGFLPPHPSPTALVSQFEADLGLTLIIGIAIAIPTIIVAGPMFARTLKHIEKAPLQTFRPREVPQDALPGSGNSFFSALLPVVLLVLTTAIPYFITLEGSSLDLITFLADPAVIMIASVVVVTGTLGVGVGRSIKSVMVSYGEAVKDIAMILLIVAGAGALKQIFVDSGVSNTLAGLLEGAYLDPLILGWLIAAFIRVCLGSATVAGLTAAGILAPVVLSNTDVDPNLMVLSIGAGSLMFSHVNDAGFWLFKEYFNLTIGETLRSWSVMETIVAIVGLLGVLFFDYFIL